MVTSTIPNCLIRTIFSTVERERCWRRRRQRHIIEINFFLWGKLLVVLIFLNFWWHHLRRTLVASWGVRWTDERGHWQHSECEWPRIWLRSFVSGNALSFADHIADVYCPVFKRGNGETFVYECPLRSLHSRVAMVMRKASCSEHKVLSVVCVTVLLLSRAYGTVIWTYCGYWYWRVAWVRWAPARTGTDDYSWCSGTVCSVATYRYSPQGGYLYCARHVRCASCVRPSIAAYDFRHDATLHTSSEHHPKPTNLQNPQHLWSRQHRSSSSSHHRRVKATEAELNFSTKIKMIIF